MLVDNIKFRVPKDTYDKLIDIFGSKDLVIDAISLYVDKWIRSKLPQQNDELVELDLFIYDKFLKKLNAHLLENHITIDEQMSKIIKTLCRRKKLQSDISELAQINKLKKDQA